MYGTILSFGVCVSGGGALKPPTPLGCATVYNQRSTYTVKYATPEIGVTGEHWRHSAPRVCGGSVDGR